MTMTKAKYQKNYASGRPQMYEKNSREEKAVRIVKLLSDRYGKKRLKKLNVLDVGASTGIIDSILAKHFKKVVGTDIDKEAINFAKNNFKSKNLTFKVEDAMKLSFKNDSFDAVICTHVYEHVPNSQQLFKEIYRVLKPGGVCYLAAMNALWPLEPHYDLLFLSWIPRNIANKYVAITGKAKMYYEHPRTYWGIKRLVKKFTIYDYTSKILQNPKKFGYENKVNGILKPISLLLSPLATFFAPTLFWVLEKERE